MSRLAAALSEILEALRETGTPMALVGGLAVSARTEPRFTRDVDVAGSACGAVRLIVDRGCQRRRDLPHDLEAVLNDG